MEGGGGVFSSNGIEQRYIEHEVVFEGKNTMHTRLLFSDFCSTQNYEYCGCTNLAIPVLKNGNCR